MEILKTLIKVDIKDGCGHKHKGQRERQLQCRLALRVDNERPLEAQAGTVISKYVIKNKVKKQNLMNNIKISECFLVSFYFIFSVML